MTEGEKAINNKFSLSLHQSFFKRKMTAPSSEGAFDGQPQGLSLRALVYFYAISAVNYHISTTIQRRQQATALPRRRLLRIVRNSLWLSLTHYTTPPFPQKSRSVRLFGCKRPHDGSLSLPTFAVVRGFVSQSLRVAYGNPPPFTRETKCGCTYGCVNSTEKS